MRSFWRILYFLSGAVALIPKTNAQTISTGIVAGHITACQGAQSQNEEVQFFTLTGSGLTGNITATASAGFIVSASENSGFSSTTTFTQSGGNVQGMVYVRLDASPNPGVISGTVTFSSDGVVSNPVPVSGNVLATPTEIPEPNINVLNGATIPQLNFEGANVNTFLWTNSNPNIGLASNGVDSLPTFRALTPGNTLQTATITVIPVWASMAYTLDPSAGVVRVINSAANDIDTAISTAGRYPGAEVLSADASRLFVLNGGGTVNFCVINTLDNKTKAEFPLPTFSISPTQLAVANNDSLLYILNFGDVTEMNTITGSFVGYDYINLAFSFSLAVNPTGNEFYATGMATSKQGVLTIDAIPSGAEKAKVLIPAGSGNLILSPDTSMLYFINPSGNISVVSIAQKRVTSTFAPPLGATLMTISPDGNTLYVIASYILVAYSTADFSIKWQLALTGLPDGIAVSPDGTMAYITSDQPAEEFIVNTLNPAIIATVPLYNSPVSMPNTVTPGGCYGDPITFTITVNPAPLPAITETGALNPLTTIYGTPSPAESFAVSGTTLRSGILVAPPAGFEVSLDDVTFSPLVTVPDQDSTANATVYIRVAASSVVGTYTGHVVLTSPGAANVVIAIPDCKVTPADLVITANDQTKAYGAPNPPLSLSFSGFVNSDGEAQLVYAPVVSTTATRNSPPGDYPINVSTAYSPNYDISFVQGTLTITPNVVIPNTFTPNGDGVNDTWDIQKIGDYPRCAVQVFNREGQLIFNSTGYSVPWDGTYKGSPVPDGTYYYVINLNANVPLLSGFVAVLR